MISTAISKSGLTIRLPEERWQHIIEGHPELADQQTNILHTIENPDRILEGDRDEFLAVKQLNDHKYLVVIYKELGKDGFIITAYLTRRINSLNKRKELWSRHP